MTQFKAFWVEKTENGVTHSIVDRSTDDLPTGDVQVQVQYSSLNYKDGMSARGLPGVTRKYPHTPGIDAAGVVAESASPRFRPGDEVIVIGFDLGMNTPGGFGQYVRVPDGWVVARPEGLGLRDSMILGTAGFTAALCVEKLLKMDAAPEDGPVLVTGATGGVGSIAVALLAKLGFEVVASSGKAEKAAYLQAIGAARVVERSLLEAENPRPLLAESYAHGVDTVGGHTLANLIKSLKYGGSVAACGLVASPNYPATVLPFILRGVNLLGIDSVELPLAAKERVWAALATDWRLDNLAAMCVECDLAGLSRAVDQILAGGVVGRTLVTLGRG